MATNLPMAPQDAAKILLQTLPAKRMRDVVERRYGLKGRSRATLEEIGGAYKITRERVRQIEADAMRRLREGEQGQIAPLFTLVENTLRDHGGVMAAHDLFSRLAGEKAHPFLNFLLQVNPRFAYVQETDEFHPRWASDRAASEAAEHTIRGVVERLEKGGKTVQEQALQSMFAEEARGESARALSERACGAYLASAKIIQKNPYGEYGLASWPTVVPRGIKDKAYTVLVTAGAPMHFRDVSLAIDRAGWPGRKKAHPQTVHNELIKDPRFILVGRGMYALQDWGYEPGTVRDILVSVLKQSQKPLGREELIRLASERRMVKPQTILLNLQDRAHFKRDDAGNYTLV